MLQASGAAPINEADLSAPPEIEMKGEKAVKKEVAAAPSHVSAAIAGSFDEDADARGFMRPSDGGGGAADAGQAAEQLQICLDGIDPSDSSLKQFLQQSLTLAAAASAVKKFTVALSIYSQILEVVPKQVDALRGIAKIHECSPPPLNSTPIFGIKCALLVQVPQALAGLPRHLHSAAQQLRPGQPQQRQSV